MKLFTIYDSAAKAFNSPFAMRHVNEAIRGFQTALTDPQSNISQYPEDYALYECGEFDNNSGEFLTPDRPVIVISALEAKRLLEKKPEVTNEKS